MMLNFQSIIYLINLNLDNDYLLIVNNLMSHQDKPKKDLAGTDKDINHTTNVKPVDNTLIDDDWEQ